MQDINIYSVQKNKDESLTNLSKEYIKMSSKLAKINDKIIYDKNIAKATKINENLAKKSYSEAFLPNLGEYNIALDVQGEEMDSFSFAKIFTKHIKINFFIAGAYGFEREFLMKTQKIISLSRLTYAHKIAKIVLIEQIYRALCINNNHPYHK